VAIATAAVVAAATFATSLTHLISSPKQQGWTFDVVVGNLNDQNDQVAHDAPLLARNKYVAAYSAIATPPETPTIDGHDVGLVGVGKMKGKTEPLMLAGRFAHAADEVVLGRASLRALHKHLGDRVTISAGNQHVSARVTGIVLGLSAGSSFNGRLDQGAVMTLAGLKHLEPDAFVTVFFVSFAPHVDRGAALASLRHDFGSNMLQHVPAQDVENLARVDALPALLAALVALLAAATLAHNLFTSVHRRRRAFATLKALGFERGQVARSVLWQTAAITIAGVVVGVPLGVVLGRSAWRFAADEIGSVQPPVVPFGIVGACILGAVALAGLIAIAPATQAARTRAARVLRDE
jgi:putative ABC transport system permease protein